MTSSKPKVAFLAGPMYGRTAGPRFIEGAPDDIEAFIIDYALSDQEKIDLCKDVEALMLLSEPYDFEFLRSCPSIKLIQSFSAGNDLLDLRKIGRNRDTGGQQRRLKRHHRCRAHHRADGIDMPKHDEHVEQHHGGAQVAVGGDAPRQHGNHRQDGWSGGSGTHRRQRGQTAPGLLTWTQSSTTWQKCPPSVRRSCRPVQSRSTKCFRLSDIVSLHVPLSSKTRKLVGARELGMMKPSAYLINTCRGGVVDEQALYETLKEGKIAGAGLDVLEEEPTPPRQPPVRPAQRHHHPPFGRGQQGEFSTQRGLLLRERQALPGRRTTGVPDNLGGLVQPASDRTLRESS